MLSLANEQIERAEREAEEEQARRGSGRGEKPAVKTRATIACGERLDGVTPRQPRVPAEQKRGNLESNPKTTKPTTTTTTTTNAYRKRRGAMPFCSVTLVTAIRQTI
jgi:hypothetical protein